MTARCADARAHFVGASGGVPYIVVFLNKVDMVDDPELIELVSWSFGSCLASMAFRRRCADCSGLRLEGPGDR